MGNTHMGSVDTIDNYIHWAIQRIHIAYAANWSCNSNKAYNLVRYSLDFKSKMFYIILNENTP